MKVRSNETLKKYLQDSELAIEYLNVALEEGNLELFWNALQHVAKAKGKSENWAEQLAVPKSPRNVLLQT